MLLGAGFARVDYRKLAGGTVALHVATRAPAPPAAAGACAGAPPPLSAPGGGSHPCECPRRCRSPVPGGAWGRSPHTEKITHPVMT